jgi:hypothetical protein
MHYFGAATAAERGYHVVTFDGPGQPAARHRDGPVFRLDWAYPVGKVLDWQARSATSARPRTLPARSSRRSGPSATATWAYVWLKPLFTRVAWLHSSAIS